MTEFEARDATVTEAEALAELAKHGIQGAAMDSIHVAGQRMVIDANCGDVVAVQDDDGHYSGGEILDYLGY